MPVYSNPWRPGQGCSNNGLPRPCAEVLDDINWRAGGLRVRVDRLETVTSFRRINDPRNTPGGELEDEEVVSIYTAVVKNQELRSRSFEGYIGGGSGTSTVVQSQNTNSNPNCFVNAVPGSPGIARGYTFGHDGYHARGPGKVFALPAMAGGEVKKVTSGDLTGASFNTIVDIAIPGGKYVALLKDMGSVSLKKSNVIRAGQEIGAVTGGPGTKGGFGVIDGLHFALIRAEYYSEYRSLTPDAANPESRKHREAVDKINRNQSKWFVDPLKEGPFQCPGITTRIDMPIRNGQPTVYPIP